MSRIFFEGSLDMLCVCLILVLYILYVYMYMFLFSCICDFLVEHQECPTLIWRGTSVVIWYWGVTH